MQIPGDALPVLDQGQRLHPSVEAGILYGHAGRSRQADDQFLVGAREHVGGGLVGQVEVAEDGSPYPNGHPEERLHRRVTGREPEAVGVERQIGQSQRPGVHDELTEDAVSLGQVPDAPVGLVVHPDGDELGQPVATLVEHAQSAVAGVDQLDGRLDDPAQDAGRVAVRSEGDDGVEQLVQAAGTGHLGHGANPTGAIEGAFAPNRAHSDR